MAPLVFGMNLAQGSSMQLLMRCYLLRMIRYTAILSLLLVVVPLQSWGSAEQAIQAARSYLHNGNPEQAVKTARLTLRRGHLFIDDRYTLLAIVAKAEILRATTQHFERVDDAIQAIDALLKEFPDRQEAAEFRWQRAWLWWKSGKRKQAITAARDIIAQDQQPENLRRAWLLLAKIHISMNKFSYARSDLLQYGLQVRSRSHAQAVGMAWMALVDRGEHRDKVALKSLRAVDRVWPDVVRLEPQIFAAYIELLDRSGDQAATLKLADEFMQHYIDTPYTARIRLMRADIHAMDEATADAAIEEYGILAEKEAETVIGRKAFMRKLMLQFRHEQERKVLLPAMVALKKIADENQLSLIEDEAMLDLARLWVRVLKSSMAKAGAKAGGNKVGVQGGRQSVQTRGQQGAQQRVVKKSTLSQPVLQSMHYPALQAYSRAALSVDGKIATAAKQEGTAWMKARLLQLLDAQQWLGVVSIWRQYPQLHPSGLQSEELQMGVAHAMRMLMLFDGAEALLKPLYARNRHSVRGERVMLELAHLWLDRHDSDGVKKVTRWLNRHEFSIYRPELLLVVARMHSVQQQPELARRALKAVQPADLTDASKLHYWQTRAEVFESLSAWYQAARSWGQYRKLPAADEVMGLARQADDLFAAQEYAAALKLYRQFSDDKRDAGWRYHTAICQLHTGAVKQAQAALQQLAADAQAGRFATLAKLALADQQAESLLGAQP